MQYFKLVGGMKSTEDRDHCLGNREKWFSVQFVILSDRMKIILLGDD